MKRLNDVAAQSRFGHLPPGSVSACTDVTGFGLAGHAMRDGQGQRRDARDPADASADPCRAPWIWRRSSCRAAAGPTSSSLPDSWRRSYVPLERQLDLPRSADVRRPAAWRCGRTRPAGFLTQDARRQSQWSVIGEVATRGPDVRIRPRWPGAILAGSSAEWYKLTFRWGSLYAASCSVTLGRSAPSRRCSPLTDSTRTT